MKEPKITQTHGIFYMACGVEVNIRAKPENVRDQMPARGTQ
jgi:hypothetical protein